MNRDAYRTEVDGVGIAWAYRTWRTNCCNAILGRIDFYTVECVACCRVVDETVVSGIAEIAHELPHGAQDEWYQMMLVMQR